VVFRNVYILPGIPQLFVAKLQRIRSELRGEREVLQSLYLDSDESQIAATLSLVAAEVPQLRIGSYPRIGDPDHRVRVTVEGTDGEAVTRALDRLLELLPAEQVLRVER
jgi:molybdopterin-biosynthesis enzyme MoeA-like protein